jgi:hypothetical protein
MSLLRVLPAVALLAVAAMPALDPAVAKRPPTYVCGDGIDNDGDGSADYPADQDCVGAYDYSELPQCSDGIDNDGNGDVDYPADEACFSAKQDVERDVPPAGVCGDGYDNDLDGKVDYPADRGCRSPSDSTETPDRRGPP